MDPTDTAQRNHKISLLICLGIEPSVENRAGPKTDSIPAVTVVPRHVAWLAPTGVRVRLRAGTHQAPAVGRE